MEHYFNLPVIINGENQSFKGRLVTFGYVYKYYIIADGQELVFEKDEEQQYRVLTGEDTKGKPVGAGIIQAIITALDNL